MAALYLFDSSGYFRSPSSSAGDHYLAKCILRPSVVLQIAYGYFPSRSSRDTVFGKVLKFLMEKNSTNSIHGQVTIGTLILQDCAVGLLFALLPILGGNSGVLEGVLSMAKSGGCVAFVFGCFVNIITDMYSLVAEANGQLIVIDRFCI